MIKITPVILCGGSGSRLWPLSRKYYPKQFLNLTGDKTLFQQTIERLLALESEDILIEEFLIITNETHRFLVLEQINALKINKLVRILLEPIPRNTAPALTMAAFASKDINTESILIVTPSDHFIKDINTYVITVTVAIKATHRNTILTLGINPDRPETGYGYIHFQGNELVKDIVSFVEKPNLETANKMIQDSNYAWNAGIFILTADTWLNAIRLSNANIFEHIKLAWSKKISDQWFTRPNEELFIKSDSDSIDYAVMEKSKSLKIETKLVSLSAGWYDLGSFQSLSDISLKDSKQNVIVGDVVLLNSKNNTVIAKKRNVSILGVDGLIVIETGDAVLVANKNEISSMKLLVQCLQKNHTHLLNEHTKVIRPWGWYEVVDEAENFKVKRIMVKPQSKLSYQSHQYRNEHWVVVKGRATIIHDNEQIVLNHDESIYIKRNVKHQLMNLETYDLEIIEVQTGEKVIESDIIRFNDIYGRGSDNA